MLERSPQEKVDSINGLLVFTKEKQVLIHESKNHPSCPLVLLTQFLHERVRGRQRKQRYVESERLVLCLSVVMCVRLQ